MSLMPDFANAAMVGNRALIDRYRLGLLCSIKCPGGVILKTYDLMSEIRNQDITFISGFHSPVERDCLNILLTGSCSVVILYARGLPKRITPEYTSFMDKNRLLLVSTFPLSVRRATNTTCLERNALVAASADELFVPYASPGGSTEALCRARIADGMRVLTLDDAHNAGLIEAGAVGISDLRGMLVNSES